MMKSSADFDFVVPVFGPAPFLEDTVRSLRFQSISASIRVRWVARPADRSADLEIEAESPRGSGIGGDWDAALGLSRARWTCIAHSDDVYSPEYVEKVLAAAELFPAAGVIFSDVRYVQAGFRHRLLNWFKRRINPASRYRPWLHRPVLIPPGRMLKALRWGSFVPCPSVSYRMDHLRQALGSRDIFTKGLKTALDWDAWISLAKSGVSFVYVPEPLVSLRVHEEATTQNTLKSGVRSAEEERILEGLWGPTGFRLVSGLLRFAQFLQRLR